MSQSTLQLLSQLEQCLKQTNNWQNTAPSTEQLASSQPFCIDTLTLPQWLQFIFIPKMREMLKQGAPLPLKVDISPYAEEVFKPLVSDAEPLLAIIKAIDESFNQ